MHLAEVEKREKILGHGTRLHMTSQGHRQARRRSCIVERTVAS